MSLALSWEICSIHKGNKKVKKMVALISMCLRLCTSLCLTLELSLKATGLGDCNGSDQSDGTYVP